MPDEMTFEAAVIEANRLKSQERMDIDRERRNAAIDKLIEAARFRIPRKPVPREHESWITDCPSCGSCVPAVFHIICAYCEYCGQALDWSDYE